MKQVLKDPPVATKDQGVKVCTNITLLLENIFVILLESIIKVILINHISFLLQDKALQLVMMVLTSFKQSEIENAVKQLDNTTIDVLMKYIYRGFEIPSEGSSAVLLTWHEKVFKKLRS